MNIAVQPMIFSTDDFAHRADLAEHAEQKVAKLLRRAHTCAGLVKVHVRREAPHSRPAYFIARASVETPGPDFVAHAEAAEPLAAINAVFDKLERLATARARKQRQPTAA
jgi:ribosome-associated translation inhibitor RaiA